MSRQTAESAPLSGRSFEQHHHVRIAFDVCIRQQQLVSDAACFHQVFTKPVLPRREASSKQVLAQVVTQHPRHRYALELAEIQRVAVKKPGCFKRHDGFDFVGVFQCSVRS